MTATTSHDEATMYKDLSRFLLSDRTDLRESATAAILQVRDKEGIEKVIKNGLIKPLIRNCSYHDPQVSINALNALINFSSSGEIASQCVEDLLDCGGINRMTEILLLPKEYNEMWRKRVNFAMAILANLTRTERGSIQLVGKSVPDEAIPKIDNIEKEANDIINKSKNENSIKSNDRNPQQQPHPQIQQLPTRPTMELLLSRFLSSDYLDVEKVENDKKIDVLTVYEEVKEEDLNSQSNDPYQHFAAVLMNVAQLEAGRRFILRIHRNIDDKQDQGSSVLQELLPQLRSSNPIRRRGVAGIIKNCCLEQESSWWLLNVVKITTHILYPLAGPEELDVDEKKGLDPDLWLEGPDKVRESDHITRLLLVESILLLCASGRKSREQLRIERVYVILKWADMVEEYEDVSERINECVQYLRRDEEGLAEGSSDKMVAEYFNRPSAAVEIGVVNEDYDDVD